MVRCRLDAEFLYLLVGDCRDLAAVDERAAIGRLRVEEAERPMAHAAHHQSGGVGLSHLVAQRGGEAKVEGGTPAPGEEHDVVVVHLEISDGERCGDLYLEVVVSEEAVVVGTSDDRLDRLRVDRNHATKRARHIDRHSGIKEGVVGDRHLAGEHAGRLADVHHCSVCRNDQCPLAGEVEGGGVGIFWVHASALQDLAE